MNHEDTLLLLRARNLAIALDREHAPMKASVVTELADRISALAKEDLAAADSDTVTIEKTVFRQLFESNILFFFLIDNIGRLSFGVSGDRQDPKFMFALNPPGRREQFLRQDVIQALMDVREKLKAPQYG